MCNDVAPDIGAGGTYFTAANGTDTTDGNSTALRPSTADYAGANSSKVDVFKRIGCAIPTYVGLPLYNTPHWDAYRSVCAVALALLMLVLPRIKAVDPHLAESKGNDEAADAANYAATDESPPSESKASMPQDLAELDLSQIVLNPLPVCRAVLQIADHVSTATDDLTYVPTVPRPGSAAGAFGAYGDATPARPDSARLCTDSAALPITDVPAHGEASPMDTQSTFKRNQNCLKRRRTNIFAASEDGMLSPYLARSSSAPMPEGDDEESTPRQPFERAPSGRDAIAEGDEDEDVPDDQPLEFAESNQGEDESRGQPHQIADLDVPGRSTSFGNRTVAAHDLWPATDPEWRMRADPAWDTPSLASICFGTEMACFAGERANENGGTSPTSSEMTEPTSPTSPMADWNVPSAHSRTSRKGLRKPSSAAAALSTDRMPFPPLQRAASSTSNIVSTESERSTANPQALAASGPANAQTSVARGSAAWLAKVCPMIFLLQRFLFVATIWVCRGAARGESCTKCECDRVGGDS